MREIVTNTKCPVCEQPIMREHLLGGANLYSCRCGLRGILTLEAERELVRRSPPYTESTEP